MLVQGAIAEVRRFSQHDGAPFPFPHRERFPFLDKLARNLSAWHTHGAIWERSSDMIRAEVVYALGPWATPDRDPRLVADLVGQVAVLYAGTARVSLLFTSPPRWGKKA